jgi:hypothetical protein
VGREQNGQEGRRVGGGNRKSNETEMQRNKDFKQMREKKTEQNKIGLQAFLRRNTQMKARAYR